MSTRLYTVHLRDNADPVLVKQGFSWPAFFIAVPWALFHRMWWFAGALIVLQLVLAALFVWLGLGEAQQVIVGLGLAIAIASAADGLRHGTLERRGYCFVDVVAASNRDHALRRFLDTRPELAETLARASL